VIITEGMATSSVGMLVAQPGALCMYFCVSVAAQAPACLEFNLLDPPQPTAAQAGEEFCGKSWVQVQAERPGELMLEDYCFRWVGHPVIARLHACQQFTARLPCALQALPQRRTIRHCVPCC